jgi:hypothetical protein
MSIRKRTSKAEIGHGKENLPVNLDVTGAEIATGGGIGAVLVGLAGYMPDGFWKHALNLLAPFIAVAYSRLYKFFKEKYIDRVIDELDIQCRLCAAERAAKRTLANPNAAAENRKLAQECLDGLERFRLARHAKGLGLTTPKAT